MVDLQLRTRYREVVLTSFHASILVHKTSSVTLGVGNTTSKFLPQVSKAGTAREAPEIL